MLLSFLTHLPAGPIILTNIEVLKEDSHGCARRNGNGDVAIHSVYIVAGISWAFHGAVDKLCAGLEENGGERKETLELQKIKSFTFH